MARSKFTKPYDPANAPPKKKEEKHYTVFIAARWFCTECDKIHTITEGTKKGDLCTLTCPSCGRDNGVLMFPIWESMIDRLENAPTKTMTARLEESGMTLTLNVDTLE